VTLADAVSHIQRRPATISTRPSPRPTGRHITQAMVLCVTAAIRYLERGNTPASAPFAIPFRIPRSRSRMPGCLGVRHAVAIGRWDARKRPGAACASVTHLGMLLALGFLTTPLRAQPPPAEFFEKKVRPVLVAHCLECHGADSKKVKGGLRLTSR